MNKIKGKITSVQSSTNISLVGIEFKGFTFSCLIIDTPANVSYLTAGKDIFVLFKETEVSIAKNRTGLISMNNCLDVEITKMSHSEIMTRLELNFRGITLVSIITKKSAERLRLTIGDKVEALIKTNEISLMEV